LKELKKEVKRGRGRPSENDHASKALSAAKERAKEIKNSRYALGKAPECKILVYWGSVSGLIGALFCFYWGTRCPVVFLCFPAGESVEFRLC
ncbi:MAG: hypothetical protein IJ252_11875, partial [Solobacterium sp.]|nr:hypothetical protein [Solobacterium sp.]